MRVLKALLAVIALTAVAPDVRAQSLLSSHLYIEANRPAVVVRALSADEQKAKAAAIRGWKGRKTEANLAAVLPFAQAGDREAMLAMVQGFDHLIRMPGDRGAVAQIVNPSETNTAMSGLWAAAYWRQYGRDKAVEAPLTRCMGGKHTVFTDLSDRSTYMMLKVSSKIGSLDCGFDVRANGWSDKIGDFIRGKAPLEKKTVLYFDERPVVDDAQMAHDRYARELQVMTDGAKPLDWAWLETYFAANPTERSSFDRMWFNSELQLVTLGMQPKDPQRFQAYIAADPARATAYRQASASWRASLDAYAAKMAPEMARLKAREELNARMAAREAESQGLSADGMIAAGAAGVQGIIARNNAVNRSNCARASMGASISCNR